MGVPVVAAPAEIDIATADELRTVLLGAAADGYTVVAVDMHGAVGPDGHDRNLSQHVAHRSIA